MKTGYGGFRCYHRGPSGRLVPDRAGGHYYSNGMYPTREAARDAANRRAEELRRRDPEKNWAAYEV